MWLVTCDGAPFEQGIGLASLKSISLYQRAKGLLHEGVLLKQPRNSYVSALGGSQPTLLAVRTHLSRHDSTIRNVQFLCKGKIDQPTACVCSNAQIKCPIFEPHTCLHSQPASRGASFVLPCGLLPQRWRRTSSCSTTGGATGGMKTYMQQQSPP